MAQKSQKQLAARNTATLNRTHIITLILHLLFNILRLVLFTRKLLPYILLTLPSLAIEVWFERISRPTYDSAGSGELRRAGEDLGAKGLTEWMWDVLYWSWGCLGLVTVLGDRAWWAMLVVPLYSAWLAFSTYSGVRQRLGGFGAADGGGGGQEGQSKRQAKLEKRGQRVQYK